MIFNKLIQLFFFMLHHNQLQNDLRKVDDIAKYWILRWIIAKNNFTSTIYIIQIQQKNLYHLNK